MPTARIAPAWAPEPSHPTPSLRRTARRQASGQRRTLRVREAELRLRVRVGANARRTGGHASGSLTIRVGSDVLVGCLVGGSGRDSRRPAKRYIAEDGRAVRRALEHLLKQPDRVLPGFGLKSTPWRHSTGRRWWTSSRPSARPHDALHAACHLRRWPTSSQHGARADRRRGLSWGAPLGLIGARAAGSVMAESRWPGGEDRGGAIPPGDAVAAGADRLYCSLAWATCSTLPRCTTRVVCTLSPRLMTAASWPRTGPSSLALIFRVRLLRSWPGCGRA